jgi:hypothetical protein
MGVNGQRHAPSALYPEHSGTHWTGGWVGPRAGLNTEVRGKILSPLSGIERQSPGCPVRSETLYWLSYPCSRSQKTCINIFTSRVYAYVTLFHYCVVLSLICCTSSNSSIIGMCPTTAMSLTKCMFAFCCLEDSYTENYYISQFLLTAQNRPWNCITLFSLLPLIYVRESL